MASLVWMTLHPLVEPVLDVVQAVILGLGAVTPYGWGMSSLWNGVHSGAAAASCVPGYGVEPTEPG
jgi:hypothetical protein